MAGLAKVRVLDRFECAAMLAMHHVARVAFHLNDRVDLELVHYVWADGWVYGRAASGAKLQSLAYNPLVAFEVDEADENFAYRSVVLRGTLYVLARYDDGPLHGEWDRAVTLLSAALPAVFVGDDPTPDGAVLFRIHASQVSGRATMP